MIRMPSQDSSTRGEELRATAARTRAMAEATGETQATVDIVDLCRLLDIAAWAADVTDEIKRNGAA